MIEVFDPDTADLKDATPRKWLVFVIAATHVGLKGGDKFAPGTAVEVFEHSDELREHLSMAKSVEFNLETRRGTNADAAAWLAGKAAQIEVREAVARADVAKRRAR